MTKYEVLQKLRELDEVALMELLEINSSDIVDCFLDKIDDMFNTLHDTLQEEN